MSDNELKSLRVNIPAEVKWTEIIDFERVDERVSCVGMLFPNTIGVCDGYIEFCPDNDPVEEEETLAWIWTIRPDLANDILDLDLTEEFRKLLESYKDGKLEDWWSYII